MSAAKPTFRARMARLMETDILVRITNMGLGFILMTLFVAVGATNTGNNGLYILVSVLFGALVVSGIVSRRNVERLTVKLDGPIEIFAARPTRFALTLQNGGRLPRRALLVKISGSTVPLLVPFVAPGETARKPVDLVFPKRGLRRIESVLVYSGYPIGLFRKGRLHHVREERLVFPALVPVTPPPPDARSADDGRPRGDRRGRAAEVRHLREAVPGDDPRDVHWRQSARQGQLFVKERASEEGRDALVALDLAVPPGDAAVERFETAVSEAASLALHLLGKSDRVGLLVGSTLVPPGSGAGQRRAILETLALVKRDEAGGAPASLPSGAIVYTVRVRPSGPGNASGALPGSLPGSPTRSAA